MKRICLILFLPPLLGLLPGCLPSDSQIEDDLSAERRAAYQEWKSLRERGESHSARVDGPLSLDDAVKIALQFNKILQESLQDRDVARARRLSAWSVALPNVTLTGSGTRTENRGGSDIDSYSTTVQVSQPVFQGEAIPARLRQSRFFTALTDQNIRTTVQNLIAAVAITYYDALLAQDLLNANREAVISAESQLRVVREKRNQETATDYDVLRAQVDVATYRAQMLSQQNSIDTNRVALLKLMGVSQDSRISFSDQLEFIPMRPVFERAVEIASGLRPDLRQAELSARMAEEAVRIAQSAYWPMVSASISEGWNDASSSNVPDSWQRRNWQAGLNASWSFGVDDIGNIQESKAEARKSRIAVLDRQEDMLREIHEYINTLTNTEETVKALEVNQNAAREALRLVEIGYQAGVKTELDVQDARKALTDVQAQYYTAITNHTKARLNLQVAMGVLGPRQIGDGPLPGVAVPIANITEFASPETETLDEPVSLPAMPKTSSNPPVPPAARRPVTGLKPLPAAPRETVALPPAPAAPDESTPAPILAGGFSDSIIATLPEEILVARRETEPSPSSTPDIFLLPSPPERPEAPNRAGKPATADSATSKPGKPLFRITTNSGNPAPAKARP
ncbi:MAG: TolC family protein [Planctomycetota bacterium]|jgi:outer membrane protein TolC|nr:TolC family protein [Planctomycetota bacterium]